jgi:hypothetical protein
MKRVIFRWLLVGAFALAGGYMLLWAIQSASYSVTLDPAAVALYQTRAIILYPVSASYFALAAVFFILLGKR